MLNVSATHVELAGYVNVDGAVHLDNNQRSVSSHHNGSGAARLARSGTCVGTVELGWGATSAAVL
jgi:hypothetical protein